MTGTVVRARPWRGPHPPAHVLAIRLHAFGDTVLTLPYLNALRRLMPTTRLDFLTRKEVAELPTRLALFDRVFALGGARSQPRIMLCAVALMPRLLLRRYDVVLDLQCSRVSRLVRTLLHPPAWSEFDRFSPVLAGERTRRTIEAAGFGPLDVRPDLQLRSPALGVEKLREGGWDGSSELVVINPAGAFPGRNWPIPHYLEFCRLWAARRQRPVQFLLLGLPKIADKAVALQRALGTQAINLVGRDVASEALAMLRQATLVLSEDSGLLHLSWVAGAPTLGLFGASRRAWARPHGNYSALVSACREPDGVCTRGACKSEPSCLERKDPVSVVDAALTLVERVARLPLKVIESEAAD